MADETTSTETWTEEIAVFHGELMIKKLEEAVYSKYLETSFRLC